MEIILFPFMLLAVPYLTLRNIFLKPEGAPTTRAGIYVLGVFSWLFALGAACWLMLPLYLIYLLLAERILGAVLPLAFYGIICGMAYHVNETLDSALVLHYVRESLFFRPIRTNSMLLREELDKLQIRKVHRESSDKPFPTAGKKKRLLTAEEVEQYKKEMITARARPIRSRHFDEEIASLKSGAPTSLADGWKVYTFDHKLHDFYDEMSGLQIDPAARKLLFNLNVPEATQQSLQNPQYLYRLKQDLYQLFAVLHTDPWLSPYARYFDRLCTVCFGIEPDSFGHVQRFPFLKLEIGSDELHQREGKFFNAADLHKISTLIFNDGKPLPDESL